MTQHDATPTAGLEESVLDPKPEADRLEQLTDVPGDPADELYPHGPAGVDDDEVVARGD
jgi:hypothetical protein